ncbi:SRPBCC family protein [Alkalihalobacillus sp. 1P02AB]|uniref:SRPBCC family protein n=1 Tax=Alkalihalobacillus sp. 1P02AB TaxID=3132260 RepID=UPI0039A64659
MDIKVFQYTTIIPAKLNTVWPFFSNPKNLIEITSFPPIVQLKLEEVESGTQIVEIDFSLSFLSYRWLAEITIDEANCQFTDVAMNPPFPLDYWKHTHTFKQQGAYTVMCDRLEITTKIPSFVLKNILQQMFKSREKAIKQYLTKNTPNKRVSH